MASATKSRKRSKASVENNNNNLATSSKSNGKRAKKDQQSETTQKYEDEDSPQEVERRIKFGRMLAVSNKKTRDKGVKKLHNWIQMQTKLTQIDLRKLWKALFFCMWMSDKAPVQEALSEVLSKLVHQFQDMDTGVGFLEAFYFILDSEWHKLDRFRLDKFYMLLKNIMKEGFVYILEGYTDIKAALADDEGMEPEQMEEVCLEVVGKYGEMLGSAPLAVNSFYNNAIKWCMTEEYLTQLAGAMRHMDKENPAVLEVFDELVDPFIRLITFEKSKTFREKIMVNVFERLLNREEKELDYVERKQETNESDSEEESDMDDLDSINSEELAKKNEEHYFEMVNYLNLGDICFNLASAPEIAQANRNILYKIRKRCNQINDRISASVGKFYNDEAHIFNGSGSEDKDDSGLPNVATNDKGCLDQAEKEMNELNAKYSSNAVDSNSGCSEEMEEEEESDSEPEPEVVSKKSRNSKQAKATSNNNKNTSLTTTTPTPTKANSKRPATATTPKDGKKQESAAAEFATPTQKQQVKQPKPTNITINLKNNQVQKFNKTHILAKAGSPQAEKPAFDSKASPRTSALRATPKKYPPSSPLFKATTRNNGKNNKRRRK